MKYGGYEIINKKYGLVIENIKDFDPVHTFDCGQCFRWFRQGDGSYDGVVQGKAVNIRYSEGSLEISNTSLDDFKNLWYTYLDLGRDYGEIKEKLRKDEHMRRAIDFGHGIRLLKQDIWEMLISFIISANNRIPMIMKTVGALAKRYGDKIVSEAGEYYAFPPAHKLAASSIEDLEVCRGGFRCKYILQASQIIREGGVDLSGLDRLDAAAARNELMKLPGVGPKVADCVLLYSGTKYDVFPTDVWVKRVMEELYFKRPASFREIQEFSAEYFGELAGFAQQYLFYYARENRIGTVKQET